MFARLFLLFIIVPIVDLLLLVGLARYTGVPLTIGLVVLTAAIGAYLVKLQGSEVRRKIFEQFSNQQMPSDLLSDGAMIMFAAGLLLTPGLLTDCFGFSLLTPVCRSFYKRALGKWFKNNFRFQVLTHRTPLVAPRMMTIRSKEKSSPRNQKWSNLNGLKSSHEDSFNDAPRQIVLGIGRGNRPRTTAQQTRSPRRTGHGRSALRQRPRARTDHFLGRETDLRDLGFDAAGF